MMSSKTIGPAGARLLTALAERDRPIFSIAEAQAEIGSDYGTVLQILRRLARAGWVVRLTAGRYAIVPLSSGSTPAPQVNRYVIARELLDPAPYYVSHDSAMDVHNMLTRPVTIVTVTSSRRLATREILGIPYRCVYAPPAALWGHTPVWVTPYEQVVVSDLERTLLDGLSRPDLCAGISQVATALWMRHPDLDWDKLGAYAERLGVQAVAQRLGYLLELFQLGSSTLIGRLQALTATGYVRLDPLLPDEGPYLARWRLRVNLKPTALESVIRT
ncbi:MAG: transcriptional regulator [Chloroflexi bacterium HGW-Chloroflexi-1]|nr:MAG: transcriptional regulator [Chloroflexi bacterium HGW-Chloroflexi-1]